MASKLLVGNVCATTAMTTCIIRRLIAEHAVTSTLDSKGVSIILITIIRMNGSSADCSHLDDPYR